MCSSWTPTAVRDRCWRGCASSASRAAGRGEDAVQAGLSPRPDLVVLDVILPDGDGFDTYRALRAAGVDAPVLFLTAHDRIEAKVHGLMMGADDYVTKPFELEEVIARVHVLLRRGRALDCRLLRVGGVALDPATREVWRDGTQVPSRAGSSISSVS